MDDRISFAKVLVGNQQHDFAKEICIVEYFDKLMAFYNLVASDYPNDHEGIQRYWFEDDHKFIMKIKFSSKNNLNKFCNELDTNNGIIFIYGLYYDLSYQTEKNNICSVELDCRDGQ